jgi:tRNA-specific 2-thiouridylase
VAVGLSGGVDSSIALWLLHRQGYRVAGVTLRMFCSETDASSRERRCGPTAIERASRLCKRLGVPHYLIDVESRFRDLVIGEFIEEYRRGRTPTPCIVCNEKIKFPALAETADRLGLAHIATGHHARVVDGPRGGPYLSAAVDMEKDQSYFLYRVPVSLLGRSLFPVGGMRKADVRRFAARAGIERIVSRESQDICFLPDGGLRTFLERYIGGGEGEVVDRADRVLGVHQGIARYTVGQRRGFGIAGTEPLYVKRIDARRNRIVLVPEEELYTAVVYCRGVRLRSRSVAPPLTAKIRYRHPAAAVASVRREDGGLTVIFSIPQRAPTPGQSLVLYRDGLVMGGGIIDRVGGNTDR